METDPEPSPTGVDPQDDGGLWMKLDSVAPDTDQTSAAMHDAGDVFIPPPPPPPPHASVAPLLPTEGSSSNSSVTLSNEAADATEAKADPSGLDWHRGERRSTATAGTAQTSEESMDPVTVEETGHDTAGPHHHNRGDEDDPKTGRDKCPKQTPPNEGEESTPEGTCGFPDRHSDCDVVGDNLITLSQLSVDDHVGNQKKTDCTQVPEIPADDQELVDNRSLNYSLTKNDWLRRESDASDTQVPQRPISVAPEDSVTQQEQADGSRNIATDIQQGEQLLQRLQLLQERQDAEPLTSQQAAEETLLWDVDGLTASDERGVPAVEESAGPEEPEQTAGAEDDDQNHEASTAPSAPHRFSAAETSMEIHAAAQEKQNLQRAGGVFNLADDPDVLEIPFKTKISLEPMPPHDGVGQFSEQKMQKEISQELQRELVLVNQGKIPGG